MSVMKRRTDNNLIHYGMDYISDSGRVLPENQSSINKGDSFSAHCEIASLPYLTPYDVLFTTPKDRYVHLLQYNFYLFDGIALCQLWEGIRSYTGGNDLQSFNRVRPSYAIPTTVPPITTPAPVSTTTPAPVSTTTPAPVSTTTAGPTTTTEAPVPVIIWADMEFRILWSEYNRLIIGDNEQQEHLDDSLVTIKEGGVATLGDATLIDVFRFNYLVRAQAHLQDEKWILKRGTDYLFRFIKTFPPVAPTTAAPTTQAPTTSTQAPTTSTQAPTTTTTGGPV